MCKNMWLSLKFFRKDRDPVRQIIQKMNLREVQEHLDLYHSSEYLFSKKELNKNIPLLQKRHEDITGRQYQQQYLTTIQDD